MGSNHVETILLWARAGDIWRRDCSLTTHHPRFTTVDALPTCLGVVTNIVFPPDLS